MKKTISIFTITLLVMSAFAQSPEKMSYQAIIRDASDNLVTDQVVGMQISILQGSASGTAVYAETQTPTTNANGLVSVEIGTGTTSDDFSAIDWANGPYFIKTETDRTGGTNYTITGTSQLLSVPYALHAKTAETVSGGISENDPAYSASEAANITATDIANLSNLSGTNTGDQDLSALATKTALGDSTAQVRSEIPAAADGSETKVTAGTNVTVTGAGTTASPYVVNATGGGERYLGEEYLGGIIFQLYIGSDGQQHGLVVSKTETMLNWQNTSTWVDANRVEDGYYNTSLMTDSPAKDWVTGLGADWYLPSIDELALLWDNRFYVNKTVRATVGTTLISSFGSYWSSTESSLPTNALIFNGNVALDAKTAYHNVVAMRAF